jgi:uncharacterized membrane protein
MDTIIGNIAGAALAIVFVGFFAIKVGAIPLLVIVLVFLAMMVYSLYDETRESQAKARKRNDGAK